MLIYKFIYANLTTQDTLTVLYVLANAVGVSFRGQTAENARLEEAA